MAGRKRRVKARKPPQKRSRGRTKRRNSTARTGRTGLGKIVATGVKSLISGIPVVGKVLGNVADFIFKGIGLTQQQFSPSQIGTTVQLGDTKYLGLAARIHVTPATLLVGSRGCVQVSMGRKIMTQYADGRVISMTVTIRPINNIATRNGDWTLAIQPFFNDNDERIAGLTGSWMPTEQGMHHMYLSQTGPASRQLQLTYRPKVTDGRAFFFNPLDSAFAEIAVLWDQPQRVNTGDIQGQEFDCEMLITGTVETRVTSSMPATNEGGYTFDSTVRDKLRGVGSYVKSSIDLSSVLILDDTSYSCHEDSNGNCTVSGKIGKVRAGYRPIPIRLEDMEI